MPEIIDDKSEHCIPFILDRIKAHREQHESRGETPPPFFIGLNGVQGAGKTTLVTSLHTHLTTSPHNLRTLVLSIDDLYLPHHAQQHLATTHPLNPLLQHRGQPGTHDIPLANDLFTRLANRETPIKVPVYDKSAFSGQGDREGFREVEGAVDVVVLEGWCVGFRARGAEEVRRVWEEARAEFEEKGEGYQGQLGRLRCEDVVFVDEMLGGYDGMTGRFGAFIMIDAEDTHYVYAWRLEQEAALRASKGTGMTDEQVVKFVNGYYPAYELYTSVLRKGIFPDDPGKQLRLVVGRDRKVREVMVI